MLGFIGRLDYQKGVDLICESFDWLMDQGVQLVMLGSGREDLENALRYNPQPFKQSPVLQVADPAGRKEPNTDLDRVQNR